MEVLLQAVDGYTLPYEHLMLGPEVGDRVMAEPVVPVDVLFPPLGIAASPAKSLKSFAYPQGAAPGPGTAQNPELRGGRYVLELVELTWQPVPSVELMEVVVAHPASGAPNERPK